MKPEARRKLKSSTKKSATKSKSEKSSGKSCKKGEASSKVKVSKNPGEYIRLIERKDKCEDKIQATWKVIENDGDGDCLFYSIMQFLQYNKIPHPNSVQKVRKSIVNHIVITWFDKFFYVTNLPKKEKKKFSKFGCQYGDSLDKCTQLYRTYMQQSSVFGTSLELGAACELYVFDCFLIQQTGISNYVATSMRDDNLTPKCWLYFTGSMDAGHFRFLEPVSMPVPNLKMQGNYKLVGRKVKGDSSISFITKV